MYNWEPQKTTHTHTQKQQDIQPYIYTNTYNHKVEEHLLRLLGNIDYCG